MEPESNSCLDPVARSTEQVSSVWQNYNVTNVTHKDVDFYQLSFYAVHLIGPAWGWLCVWVCVCACRPHSCVCVSVSTCFSAVS